ncbi:pentatricopeptide repeat-containing protein At3g62890-like [Miscanthus floridulus]|uniref:pentatricopeptide repeat-containing protein At3g62890-like n=1 Tax=Miscanthus floridulus TaxID=154761 RepID=UPI00345AB34A
MQFGTPPPSPAARRAPTFHSDPAADATQLLSVLLPPRPALHHVLQVHARLAVLGLATARALPQLLAALPRLPLAAAAASHSYPLSLFRCASCASSFASNHLLRVLPHPLPLRLFPRLPRRNPHSFTFLLASLSNHLDADPAAAGSVASRFMGTPVHALAVKAGAAGDLYVRNALIHFYGVCGDVAAMRKVFDELPLVRDVVTWNAVLAGYVRAGMVGVAREVFDGMPVRDEVSWSTVVGGYVKEGELEVALGVFKSMVVQGVKANEAAIVTALSAAAQLGLLEQGKFVHEVVKRVGMAMGVNLGAALVDMYSKCGSVAAAKEVFDAMPRRDMFAWNSMICGLATHGLGHDAVQLFEKFVSEGFWPTSITFVGVLNACSRTGLVDEGRWYFKLMAEKYGIESEMEHYGCMVDLLSRAGLVQEAIELIEGMHIPPDPVLWGTVLSACKRHGLVDLGISVGNKLIELDPAHDGHYVLLASIYAKAKKWDEVRKVRKLMSNRGTSKSAGWSLMEAHGIVHKFLVGDMDHKGSVHIYNMLCMIDRRLAEAGYVPDVSSVLHDIGDEEKVHAIKVHSERLAIAYGFIVVEAGSPIRIVKNLSVCGDCHEFSKMVTKVFGREIVVRDGSRFHHMKDGKCSCHDYW